MSRKFIVASLLAAGATFAVPKTAVAEDSAFRQELIHRSVRSGLGQASLPLLARQPGSGRQQAAEALKAKLCGGRCDLAPAGAEQVRLRGEGWELTVHGDGTSGQYRNLAGMARMQQQGRAPEERLSMGALEKLGRAFVADTLAPVVVLGEGEELVPFKSVYELRGGQDVKGGPVQREVVGNTLVFTRTLHGVAVVGAGSKVAVTFANDGTPVAFDYDWPRYAPTGGKQVLAPRTTVLQRVQTVAALRSSASGASTGSGPFDARAPAELLDVPAALLPDVLLEKLECGYFDAGQRKRDARAVVQAGCFAHLSQQHLVQGASGEGFVKGAYAGAIPAGEDVVADSRWGELALLGLANTDAHHEPAPASPSGGK